MKHILHMASGLLLAVLLTACGRAAAPLQAAPPALTPASSLSQGSGTASGDTAKEQTGELLVQLTTEQGETILFALNSSNAAKSFYEQMPLSLKIEDYSDNEKIFYPPEKLDTGNAPMAGGPAGTLAYYAPWGDVAIYYGDCGAADGLYQLGQAVLGAEHIATLRGVVQLEAVDSAAPPQGQVQPQARPKAQTAKGEIVREMQLTVGEKAFTATLEENAAVDALLKLLQGGPVTVTMRDHGGFEKVGALGTSLPASDSSITATAGEIVLYNANQLVVFYGSNAWSYTRLGKIDDLSGWEQALGAADVTITLSIP